MEDENPRALDDLFEQRVNSLQEVLNKRGILRVELSPDLKKLYWVEVKTGRRIMTESVESGLMFDQPASEWLAPGKDD
jgi:hypothetical protein